MLSHPTNNLCQNNCLVSITLPELKDQLMHSDLIITFCLIFFMILLNGIFAGYEIALASVNLGRLKVLSEANVPGSKSALDMKLRMEASLAVVQIGITLAGAIAAATSGVSAKELITPAILNWIDIRESVADFLAIAIVVIPLTSVTIIFAELVPKTIAIKNNEIVCLKLSPFMQVVSYMVYPSILFFEWSTKNIVRLFESKSGDFFSEGDLGLIELKAQANALKANRIINLHQEQIILGASNLSQVTCADIFIPVYEVVSLYVDDDLPGHFVTIHLDPYTRFPVIEEKGNPSSIIGYVNIKEVIFLAKTHPNNPNLREILRPLISMNEDTSIGDAFAKMMREHVHVSLVKDKNQKILGIITLEDILEEVVGDIQDEFDRLPKHLTQLGKSYIVGGGVSLNTVLKTIKMQSDSIYPDNLNMSDWLRSKLQKKIQGGDVFEIDGLKILVRKVKMNRIFEVSISINDSGLHNRYSKQA
ncbi:hemolysin family protein [Leptospira sp. GIMC2001]|uniref:hemolysin family protein n=1 Tax=Leptospira sp. GIMC2001 TaxID=1513297 RepID=UPI0023494086|nr:hemolysin family protein [Leptospira sp. GIMC2001]WCL50918.1 hemolysin family protein [Leptospira sp. GIMC2001]